MTLFIQLILAHLAGDFLLQPGSMVRHKEQYRLRSYYLYVHVLIHGALVVLIAGPHFWLSACFIAISHLIIDGCKITLTNEHNRRMFFFGDQVLHLLMILLAVTFYDPRLPEKMTQWLMDDHSLLLILCIVFLTTPVSVLMRVTISKWTPSIGYKPSDPNEEDSLMNAGKYIGMLERLFVFGFIVSNHFDAIGFLLAAKSIFRFGDLRGANDRKLTEYVLIGTLISFGVAIVTGWAYNELYTMIP